MPDSGQQRPVTLFTGDSRTPLVASMHRGVSPQQLQQAENLWATERARLVAAQRHRGRGGVTQHGHWKWTNKVESVVDGDRAVFGIQLLNEWQALMAVMTEPRPSRRGLPLLRRFIKRSVVYVDFLEAAPWNNADLTHPDPPRYSAGGTLLLIEAIRCSMQIGHRGRVGLHALDQSVPFYRTRGMTLLVRRDRDYLDLPYLEYTERAAAIAIDRFG